jgi:hypothetical protein
MRSFEGSETTPSASTREWGWEAAQVLAWPLLFRLFSLAVMGWLLLWAEGRAAPSLPDALLERIPYVAEVDRYNYLLWTLGYVPLSFMLFFKDVRRFARFVVAGAWVALVRRFCVAATGLGPVRGSDIHAGLGVSERWDHMFHFMVPFNGFLVEKNPFYLTKDLFFSGHTSTTLILLLYVWRYPRLRWPMLVCHVLVVGSVFFSHLHYTIDVIGAYAITFSIYVLMEADLPALLHGREAQPRSLTTKPLGPVEVGGERGA